MSPVAVDAYVAGIRGKAARRSRKLQRSTTKRAAAQEAEFGRSFLELLAPVEILAACASRAVADQEVALKESGADVREATRWRKESRIARAMQLELNRLVQVR